MAVGAAMVAAIGLAVIASRRRRTREDPATALLELWVALADLLSAYQHAVAEEAYLGGRRRRRRVLRCV
jgi:hypothetical protein